MSQRHTLLQQLLDEHTELQLEYNTQERKKKDLENENDRLVCRGRKYMYTVHAYWFL